MRVPRFLIRTLMLAVALTAFSWCFAMWVLSDSLWQVRVVFLGMIVVGFMLIRWAFFAPKWPSTHTRLPTMTTRRWMVVVVFVAVLIVSLDWTTLHHRSFMAISNAHREALSDMDGQDHISARSFAVWDAERSWHKEMEKWHESRAWMPWVSLIDNPMQISCRHGLLFRKATIGIE